MYKMVYWFIFYSTYHDQKYKRKYVCVNARLKYYRLVLYAFCTQNQTKTFLRYWWHVIWIGNQTQTCLMCSAFFITHCGSPEPMLAFSSVGPSMPHSLTSFLTHSDEVFLGLPHLLVPGVTKFVTNLIQDGACCTSPDICAADCGLQ